MIKKFKLFENMFSEKDEDFIRLKSIIEDSLIDDNVEIKHRLSTDSDAGTDFPDSEFTTSATFEIFFRGVSGKVNIGQPYTGRTLDYDDIIVNVDGYLRLSKSVNSLLYRLKESKYQINQFSIREDNRSARLCVIVTLSFIIDNEKLRMSE